MKLYIFLAIAIAMIALPLATANAQASCDTVNGWYFWGADSGVTYDTAYHYLDTNRVQGETSEYFASNDVNATWPNGVYWEKRLDEPKQTPTQISFWFSRNAGTSYAVLTLSIIDDSNGTVHEYLANQIIVDSWFKAVVEPNGNAPAHFTRMRIRLAIRPGFPTNHIEVKLDNMQFSYSGSSGPWSNFDMFEAAPKMFLPFSSSDFPIYVSCPATSSGMIHTSGTGLLKLKNIYSDNPNFSVSPSSANINAGDSVSLFITACSSDTGASYGNVVLVSNADSSPDTIRVSMYARVPLGMSVIKPVFELYNWQMVSTPVHNPPCVKTLYPLFSYNNGYKQADTMASMAGYWTKWQSPPVFVGEPSYRDTGIVLRRWNMAGCIAAPTATKDVRFEPDSILQSAFFGYDGRYFVADTLYPAHAYWVKVKQDGKIIMDTAVHALGKVYAKRDISSLNTIAFTDAGGKTVTLYFGSNTPDEAMYELPPMPPTGSLDARFTKLQGLLKDFGKSKSEKIQLQAQYPVSISWNVKEGNYFLNKLLLQKQGTITLVTSEDLALSLAEQTTPTKFALAANYPNPFNPTTTIGFTIPSKQQVLLKVYNTLGQTVSTLVDEVKEAGAYQVEWDASNCPSGVYFYQLQAGINIATQKMALIK